jgi:hypothetical protein
MTLLFAICLFISVALFSYFWYRFKSWDYIIGFLVGAIVIFLLIMGNMSNGI